MSLTIPVKDVEREMLNHFKLEREDLLSPKFKFDEIDWLELIIFLEISFKKNIPDEAVDQIIENSSHSQELNICSVAKILNDAAALDDGERTEKLKILQDLEKVQFSIPNQNKKRVNNKSKNIN